MPTLFDATLNLAREIGLVFEGDADTGSTDALLKDSALTHRETTFRGGTLFIISGTHAGVSRVVNQQPPQELAFDTLPSALVAGDDYAVAEPDLTREQLRRAVNLALQNVPEYTEYNVALATVANQEDYALPVGVANLDSVEIARATAAPLNHYYHEHYIELNDGTLRFTKNVPALGGYELRIGYPLRHAWLINDVDAINPGIDVTRLKWESAVIAWREFLQKRDSRDLDSLNEDWFDEAAQRAAAAPPHRVKRVIHRGMP